MNIHEIKHLLTDGAIDHSAVKQLLNTIRLEDVVKLTEEEKAALNEIINGLLLMSLDPTTGAYIESPDKAEKLLEMLS